MLSAGASFRQWSNSSITPRVAGVATPNHRERAVAAVERRRPDRLGWSAHRRVPDG